MKTAGQKEIVIIAAKRTPFGSFGGGLKSVSATDLGVVASKAAIEQAGIDPEKIDHVVFGNVMQTSSDAIYLGRHVGLKSGLLKSAGGLTINRLCGSGFQAIINGARRILLGESECVLVGGAESMSQSPHIVRGARWGIPLGKSGMEDSLWSALTDSYNNMPMAITAENLAVKYEIPQEDVDNFSVRSQQLHAKAQAEGYYSDEMAPVTITKRRKEIVIDTDEHGRPETTLEGLQKLPKIFKKDGVIHAGAASGICDGAGALIIASKEFAQANGCTILAKVVNWGITGCDPDIMGIGPVPAMRSLFKRAECSLEDIDQIDVNEAFAPQALAVQKEMSIPAEKYNLDGGAIAVGHPLAASGARIAAHMVYSLKRNNHKYGVGAACIGGGQGIALMLESV